MPHPTTSLAERFGAIRQRIDSAASAAKRSPQEVTLVAVSKTFGVEAIKAAYDLGVRDFGESYVQEWRGKIDKLPDDIRWHFIGHVQSNKIKDLARGGVALLHSVDRQSVLKAIGKRRETSFPILLQFNVAGEAQKSGAAPGELAPLLEAIWELPNVSLRGLMTVPPQADDPHASAPHFRALSELRDEAQAWLRARDALTEHPCEALSIGMSSDFEVAIAHGATIVRVGSLLFGERS